MIIPYASLFVGPSDLTTDKRSSTAFVKNTLRELNDQQRELV